MNGRNDKPISLNRNEKGKPMNETTARRVAPTDQALEIPKTVIRSLRREPRQEPASTESAALADAVARLKMEELPAPVRSMGDNIMACANAAANDMEAQAAHLREVAEGLDRDAKVLREDALGASEAMIGVARNIGTGTRRSRSAVAMAHQAQHGGHGPD